MRTARTLAGLVLVGGMATACGGGGGSDAPEDASKKEFCAAVAAAPTDGKPSQEDVDSWVDELEETGTPDDLPEDARHGFEVFVEAVDDADVKDIKDATDFEEIVEDEDDRADVTSFLTYFATTCTAGGRLPGEFPTDDLSPDDPSNPMELPTEGGS